MHILLVTPPLTQLNTPYPATAFLKGFLKQHNYRVSQMDLGIDLVISLFSEVGLRNAFDKICNGNFAMSENALRIFHLRDAYLRTINTVVSFLQGADDTLAHRIGNLNYLPQAGRFVNFIDEEWAFGTMGIRDKARFVATLYIEDLGDLLRETIAPNFAFTRYAEQIARAAHSYDALYHKLQCPPDYTDVLMLELLEAQIQNIKPQLVGFSVPFPGNLYGALRSAQWLKLHYPEITTVMGGGYPNTELRQINDPRVFELIDFITLDDGEAPLLQLLSYLENPTDRNTLVRTFALEDGKVRYYNNPLIPDISHAEIGCPDYEGLDMQRYLSVIELTNPMHRLWSDGKWNKLMLAHGCYWHRCTFCDVTLDYIKRYNPTTASQLVDRIERIVAQTGQTGFHFVDEAAPPLLLRDLSIELLRRRVQISWWTNVRFEKTYSPDLCQLMSAAGCIAATGGLEVASDRLLKLIKKGTSLLQVSKITRNFSTAGIMVHAYLMYGFPTQTEIETIDSLEVVRQLFALELIQSGFWHHFALTTHSPIGQDPKAFKIQILDPEIGSFANNDLRHADPTGGRHELYGEGLNKAVYNYMHKLGFEHPLQNWFDFRVPKTTQSKELIQNYLQLPEKPDYERLTERVLWLGLKIEIDTTSQANGAKKQKTKLNIFHPTQTRSFKTESSIAQWILKLVDTTDIHATTITTLAVVKESFPENHKMNFTAFLLSNEWQMLRQSGLLLLRQ
ncbi:MAG: hypothetical protein RIS47_1440 [Bacteroidota bacterium]|jgi:hypothetical protein